VRSPVDPERRLSDVRIHAGHAEHLLLVLLPDVRQAAQEDGLRDVQKEVHQAGLKGIMFGFNRDEDGSQERFHDHISLFRRAFRSFPRARHHAWWLVHNCISHPLIGLLPIKLFFDFHDWTSRMMHPTQKKRVG
jgi:hypothetical protein